MKITRSTHWFVCLFTLLLFVAILPAMAEQTLPEGVPIQLLGEFNWSTMTKAPDRFGLLTMMKRL